MERRCWSYVAEDFPGDEVWYEDEEEFFDPYEYEAWTGEPASSLDTKVKMLEAIRNQKGIFSAGGTRGKGKGAFGSGCHICGSKWHMAADCPVRGKGKNFSPQRSPKGKGKFGKGKSKGKGKWRSKGNGGYKGRGKGFGSKSSWGPRYYTNYENDATYYDYQVRHARQGLHLGDSPRRMPGTTAATKYFSIATGAPARSEYFEDLLKLERTRKPAATEAETTTTAEDTGEAPRKSEKTLAFFFRKTSDPDDEHVEKHQTYHEQPNVDEIFHTVEGRRRRGLIIDPGAANGLIGSETLRDLLANVDQALRS